MKTQITIGHHLAMLLFSLFLCLPARAQVYVHSTLASNVDGKHITGTCMTYMSQSDPATPYGTITVNTDSAYEGVSVTCGFQGELACTAFQNEGVNVPPGTPVGLLRDGDLPFPAAQLPKVHEAMSNIFDMR